MGKFRKLKPPVPLQKRREFQLCYALLFDNRCRVQLFIFHTLNLLLELSQRKAFFGAVMSWNNSSNENKDVRFSVVKLV